MTQFQVAHVRNQRITRYAIVVRPCRLLTRCVGGNLVPLNRGTTHVITNTADPPSHVVFDRVLARDLHKNVFVGAHAIHHYDSDSKMASDAKGRTCETNALHVMPLLLGLSYLSPSVLVAI